MIFHRFQEKFHTILIITNEDKNENTNNNERLSVLEN